MKEGDVLLEFDSEDLQQQYDTLKKSMENADNLTAHNHTINERNLENAKRDKETNLEQAQRSIDDAISARDKAYAKEADLVNRYNAQLGTVNDISARLNAAEDPEIYVALSTQLQEAQMTLSGYDTQLESIREQLSSFDSAVQTANDAYAQTERSADQMIQSYQDVLDNEQFSNDNSSENELKKLEDAIKDCTVRATKSGIVTSLNVAEGSIPTAEALMTIEDKDTLKITVSIAEADILK
ncbi:MAG: HlyD family efflux transporter periplasmic adaptor subunit, partial [Oscillospiraceae bacterium]|nr:HlyD family efflux transporter periplasmic adaptor subunit [Oscillospiraceae bacterium]